MDILITGASGFVGTALCMKFLERGERVTGIGTSRHHPFMDGAYFHGKDDMESRFQWVSADTTQPGEWQEVVKGADVIVNLTGRSIFGYWTENYKQAIYTSRVRTTRNIVDALSPQKEAVLLNTSAAGYYGDRGEDILIETDGPGDDFLARVCIDWEDAARSAQEKGSRVVLMRFGVVLGRGGGALGKMLPAFRFFAGGPLGKGLHWFPWIHMEDLIDAMIFFIENKDVTGPVNLVAPGAIRHKEFASALGRALHRPSFMPAPEFLVKTFMGEMGRAFLSSQRAKPGVLEDLGFRFRHGEIQGALESLVT
ncbi:MAG: TIGR01777 family protein [Desulfamplus sp.]|nr:TIGR01777 family protein [Desulfamplus sp.]